MLEIVVGKPYLILKSKDTVNNAQCIYISEWSYHYTVVKILGTV